MRTRTTLAAATLFAAGALLGWITASGQPTTSVRAQDQPGGKMPDVPRRFDDLATFTVSLKSAD
jgi:hypothetical protein